MNRSKPVSKSVLTTHPSLRLSDDPKRKLLACVEGLTPNQCTIVLKLIDSMDRLAKVKRSRN